MEKPTERTEGMRRFDRPDGSSIDPAVTMSQMLGTHPKFKDGHLIIDEGALVEKFTSSTAQGVNTVFILCKKAMRWKRLCAVTVKNNISS